MKSTTELALRASMTRAIRHLEDHVDSPPPVSQLARVAGLSEAHFQREFKRIIGITIGQYSQRIRLDRAAALLKFSAWQIQEICLTCGFENPASFTRAFRKKFSCTPLQWREDQGVSPFLRGLMRPSRNMFPASPPSANGHAQVETWPTLRLAMVRYLGPVGGLLQPWRELAAWVRNTFPDPAALRYFGLWFDDWSHASTPQTTYRYEAAVCLPEDWTGDIPEPFQMREIPTGRVAWAETHGNLAALDRAWKLFAYGWLPYSGHQPRGEFVLDEYPPGLIFSTRLQKAVAGATGFSIRMCLPVQTGRMTL